MKGLIFALVLCFATCVQGAERVFTVNSNFDKVVRNLPVNHQPFELPPELHDIDVKVVATALIKHGYVKIEVKLRKPHSVVSDFFATLEFWDQGNRIVVRERANIEIRLRRHRFPLRWLNRIKDRIVDRRVEPFVEREIMDFTEKKIRSLTR